MSIIFGTKFYINPIILTKIIPAVAITAPSINEFFFMLSPQ